MNTVDICPICRPELSIGYTGEIKMAYCPTHDKHIIGNADEMFEPVQAIEKELQ